MSRHRFTPEIVEAILASPNLPSLPAHGSLPNQSAVTVEVNGTTHVDIPVVVAHAFIAGSGPIGYVRRFLYVLFSR